MNNRKNDIWNFSSRKSKNIPIALNNLILCCGEKTEKQYFERMCEIIKNNYCQITGINFDIQVCALDPLKMANKAKFKGIQSSQSGKEYQHVWVVFDKDDFEKDNFDNSIKKLIELNKSGVEKGPIFHPLWSNECIELWFLLHFIFLESNITRKDYENKLSKRIGEKYLKNDIDIFEKIQRKKGCIRNAIINAKKEIENHKGKTPSECKPATTVFEFFEHYKEYLPLE